MHTELLATWGIDYNYCYICRSQCAAKGSNPTCEGEKRNFKSRIAAIESSSKEDEIPVEDIFCSVIQDMPFDLMPENKIAYEICTLAHQLSPKMKYEYTKNSSQYWTYIPTLDRLLDAIEIMYPDGIDQNELYLLIKKVNIIHNYKMDNIR